MLARPNSSRNVGLSHMNNYLIVQCASRGNACLPGYYQWLEVWQIEGYNKRFKGTWIEAPGHDAVPSDRLPRSGFHLRHYEGEVYIRCAKVEADNIWQAAKTFREWEDGRIPENSLEIIGGPAEDAWKEALP